MRPVYAATLVAAAVAAPAAATTFSFASDFASDRFTFENGEANAVPVDLLIDDENGFRDTLSIETRFSGDFTLAPRTAAPEVAPGVFVHTYSVRSPDFEFRGDIDGDGNFDDLLLSVSAGGAVQTVIGGENTWGSAGSIFSDRDAFGQGSGVVYTVQQALIDLIDTEFGVDAADYGIFAGDSIESLSDFAFTLTNIQADPSEAGPFGEGGIPVTLDPEFGRPDIAWVSEGSFSGTARFIPAPGIGAVLLGGLGLAGRRRR